MIYITGDCHADFRRFNKENFPEQNDMTADDFVIVAGDLGLIWDGSKEEQWWIKWFSEKPFTLLFIDGNHDNHDMLDKMPEESWHGGRTHVIAPNIRHLMRGQIFDIDGKKIFTFGGAKSHDITDGILDPDDPEYKGKLKRLRNEHALYRIKGVSWWEKEMPSEEEYEEGLRNLDNAGWNVDFIITHCAPASVQSLIDSKREPDALTDYLEEIRKKCSYDRWFFGHYHEEEAATDKDICLYEQITRIV